jgi:ERCC4-related helicase
MAFSSKEQMEMIAWVIEHRDRYGLNGQVNWDAFLKHHPKIYRSSKSLKDRFSKMKEHAVFIFNHNNQTGEALGP